MQISSITMQTVSPQTGYNQQLKKQSVNFNGVFRRNVLSDKHLAIKLSKEELINYIKYYFKSDIVYKLNVNNNIERNNMLLSFAEKFVAEIRRNKNALSEQDHIFEQVLPIMDYQNKAQKLILKDYHYSTEDFINISKHLDKRHNVELTAKLFELKDEKNVSIDFSKTLAGILKMPKTKKLNQDFYKYKSYIILNFKKENFLENLEKEINQNGDNIPYKKLDKIVEIRKKQIISPVLSKIPEEILIGGNSNAVNMLTDGYTAQVFNQYKEFPEEGIKFLKYFITTSNSDNFGTRVKFLKNNLSHVRENQSFDAMQLLFEKIDNDKNIQKILDKFLNNKQLASSVDIRKFLFYIDKFGSEQLAENADNFVNIIELSRLKTPDEIVEIIENNLKNKYYTTPEEIKAQKYNEKFQGKFARIKGRLKRSMRDFLETVSGPFPKVKRLNDVKFEDYKIVKDTVNRQTEVIPAQHTAAKENLNVQVAQNIDSQPVIKEITSQPVVDTKTYIAKKPLAREYTSKTSGMSAKKLKIFNEGQEIIKTRMKSAAQIQEQARDYSLTATKMRNKYLNELFNYVSDVRKAENKAKIKKHSVSNYDVLELYQKINGYNEKEFRKMLKARNENGERMYSFEEINNMLDNSIIEHYKLLREKQAAKRKPSIEQLAIA